MEVEDEINIGSGIENEIFQGQGEGEEEKKDSYKEPEDREEGEEGDEVSVNDENDEEIQLEEEEIDDVVGDEEDDDPVEEVDALESDSERDDSSKQSNMLLASKMTDENFDDDENYESEESDDEPIDGKITSDEKLNYIRDNHIQEIVEDYVEMSVLANVLRNKNGDIVDMKHTTTPIMTKYEKTRILGLRISQLNNGARRLYTPENNVIDNNIIAEKELEEKLLPFIISRPLPNGTKEHWRIQDLEIL